MFSPYFAIAQYGLLLRLFRPGGLNTASLVRYVRFAPYAPVLSAMCSLSLRAYAAMRLWRRRLGILEIDDFDFFSHLFEALGEFVDEVHLDVEVDGQIGVLVSGIDGASDEEVDVGGFFEEESADRRGGVVLVAPFFVEVVFIESITRVFEDFAHGDDAFGDEVDAFDFAHGWDIAAFEAEAGA